MWDENGLKWMHFSKHPTDENGMIVTFMLRVVQSVRRVIVENSTFYDKGEDEPKFSSVRDTYQLDEDYIEKVAIIDGQLEALCNKKIN